MKETLGCIRKADKDFQMLQSGDKVCVGVSGGKDSLVLLRALHLYRYFSHTDFELIAVMLTLGFDGFDYSGVEAMCRELQIPLHVRHTNIGQIVFEDKKVKNPCSLCAKMRRGALNEEAKALGCNKVALGHHRDDALETLLMSLLYEGRLHTFQPVTYLSRSDLTVIRPMLYLPEKHVVHVARSMQLPIVHNPCPADGHTRRQEMKELLDKLCKTYPWAREYMLSALRNDDQYGLWEKPKPAITEEE